MVKQDMSNSSAPLVSVVIPIFNRETVLEKTLDSIKNQIYRPLELILVDDGSTDNSPKVILQWSSRNKDTQLHLIYRRIENSGAPIARNKGMQLCNGQYLQFLDSDDIISPEKIAEQVHVLETTGAGIAVCDFQYIYNDSKRQIQRNDGPLRAKLAKDGSASIFTPLIRLSLIRDKIYWNENLKRNQDKDFFFKAFCLAPHYIYTPGVWCDYIIHDGEQISDQYCMTVPQFYLRIASLSKFGVRMHKHLTLNRKILLLRLVIKLAKSWAAYWPKRALQAVLSTFILTR